MKIAFTAQNRRSISAHPGKCRNFLVYEVEGGKVLGRSLLELSQEDMLEGPLPQAPHPLDEVQVLVSGSMGTGMQRKLARRGITALVTSEADPDTALELYLAGMLPRGEARAHDGEAGHHHAHRCGCGQGPGPAR